MKKPVLSFSVSLLLLASCGPAPVQPSPSPTPTPTPQPSQSPVFQGQTTLSGTIALDAQSVIVEAANATGTFRKAVTVSNKTYRIENVPVGERIRVRAQYRNNNFVTLSAVLEAGEAQREKVTTLDINLETTATDLIYARAAAENRSAIVAVKPDAFVANAAVTPFRQRLVQVLQEIMATPIDAIVVDVPTAPKVTQTLSEILPAIEAVIQNQPVPSPTPTSSAVPSGQPTPVPSATTPPSTVFTPVRLMVKPGKDVTIAKDTSLKLWIVGVDALGKQQTVPANFSISSSAGQGNLGPDGVFTPASSGTFTYTASYGTLSETITIRVTDGILKDLEIVPNSDITLDVGQPFELQAKGTDDKGNTVVVTPAWSLSNTFVGQVDGNGVFTPLQAGKVDLTARAREFSSGITITVQSASSFVIETAPDPAMVLPGRLQPIQVFALDFANNSSATSFSFSVQDPSIGSFLTQDTSINGITPSAVFQATKAGTTQITVKDIISNRSKSFPITVAEGIPHIASLQPANSVLSVGQTITLSGENFSANAGANQVLFNKVAGTVLSATPTTLLVTVPVGAFTGMVTVVTDGKRGSSYPFVIAPRLDSVLPLEAGEGDLVTLNGQNFSTDNPAHNVVFFDSERASIPLNVSNSSLQVRVPSNLDSEVQISLRVKGQISNFREFKLAGSSFPNWDERDPAKISRAGAKAEVISGNVYVLGSYQAGDSDDLHVYNVSTNTWTTSNANLPIESANLATAMLDDLLYAVGGSGDSSRIYRYEPNANIWKSLDGPGPNGLNGPRLKNAHVGAVAETYNGKLYVIGGQDSNGRVVEECNFSKTECDLKQNSPTRRHESASVLYNGRIYVIGGSENGGEDRITAYNIQDDKWETGLTPMPKRLRRAQAVVINNRIMVIGGEDETGAESDRVYEFNPNTNAWRTLKSLPSARSGAAVAAISSRLHVIGGLNSSGTSVSTNFRGQL